MAENITLSLSLWICWSEQTVQSALYDSFVTTVVACTAISSVVSWSLDPSELLNFQNCQAQNGRANREGGQVPEMCIFYDFQIAMENVHSEMYSLLISAFMKVRVKATHLISRPNQTKPNHGGGWREEWQMDDSYFAFQKLCAMCTGPFCDSLLGVNTNSGLLVVGGWNTGLVKSSKHTRRVNEPGETQNCDNSISGSSWAQ